MDMTPEQFWSMSPRLFALKVDGYFSRENRAGYYFREAFALQVNMNRKENAQPITGQEILPLYGEKKQRSNSRRRISGWTQERIDVQTARFNLAPEQLKRYLELRETEPFKYDSEGEGASDPRVFPHWPGWQLEFPDSGNLNNVNQEPVVPEQEQVKPIAPESEIIERRVEEIIQEYKSVGLAVIARNDGEDDFTYAHRLSNYSREYHSNLSHRQANN